MNRPIRTRFAPSPTGYMHIGGMRTALFNWLFAKHHGGTFVLRIDDTDQQRNMEEAVGPILNAFRWLGLDWDEGPEIGGDFGPYFQSERTDLYAPQLQKLLDAKLAYADFDPPELTKQDREAADKSKTQYVSARRSLELSDSEIAKHKEDGTPHVYRLLIPRERTIVIDDAIRGRVEFDASLMVDPVIYRSNGTPLYNFASVVDDGSMEISHIIRAEEHLSNTPIQFLLFEALGYEMPTFAHIPCVAAPGTKEKMSKRKLDKYKNNPKFKSMFELADTVFPKLGLEQSASLDPVMVEYYEKIGFLPAGVLNGLSRLGWSLDDKTEIFSLDDVVKNFSLERVVKSPAGFDPDKLMSYQAHWMGELSLQEKIDGCLPYLVQAKFVAEPVSDTDKQKAKSVIEAMGDRLVLFSDILKFDEFFVADDALEYDSKAFKKRIKKPENAVELLTKFKDVIGQADAFDVQACDDLLHKFVDAEEISIGLIINALRVAVTGKGAGTGMFEAMAIIGKDSCVKRIDRAIAATI